MMANHVTSILARRFPLSRNELVIGEVSAELLAETYGTPLYVYDRAAIDAQFDCLRATLPRCFTIFYSIKANPNPAVVQHLSARGCGLEVASIGEFHIGRSIGCAPSYTVFAGPGKTLAELEGTISQGIGELHVESLLEAQRVAHIARRLGVRQKVAIRVNPAGEAEGGAMRMGGRPAPFGIDEEMLDQALTAVCSESALEFTGIHLFVGTQILDADILIQQYRHGLSIARRAAECTGCSLQTVDFGGGLGVPYFAHEQQLDVNHLRQGLGELFANIVDEPAFANTRFLVEPGRFLTAEAGVYLARVIDVKTSRGKKFVVLDGGMNHHLAASGNLGQTIKRNYPIALVNKLHAAPVGPVDFVGPLCTPLDTLARNLEVASPEVGDLVGIFQSGAYGRSASPLGFLSHPAPPEIWVDGTTHVLVTARGDTAGEVKNLAATLVVSE